MKRPSMLKECKYIGYTRMRQYTEDYLLLGYTLVYAVYVHKTTGDVYVRKTAKRYCPRYSLGNGIVVSRKMVDVMAFLKDTHTYTSRFFKNDSRVYLHSNRRVKLLSREEYLLKKFPQLKPYIALDLL